MAAMTAEALEALRQALLRECGYLGSVHALWLAPDGKTDRVACTLEVSRGQNKQRFVERFDGIAIADNVYFSVSRHRYKR